MLVRRTNARLVRWTSPLWSSLLLAGCDAVPRMPQDAAAIQTAIDSRLPAHSKLRPCAEPALLSPGEESGWVLATSHPMPMPMTVERLPAIPRPFPSVDPGLPLSVTHPQQLAPRVANSRPMAAAVDGPALVPPGGHAAEAEFGPPPAPQVSDEETRSLRNAAAQTRPAPAIRSRPMAATEPRQAAQPAPQLNAAADAAVPLPPPPARSPEVEAVARQAERQVRRGFDLAARGALYGARAQFIQALRTIAQAQDVRSGDRRQSEALSAGLGALEEAEDFVPRGSRLEADLDIGTLVQGHRTPVLKNAAPEELSAVTAQQRYYTYAQEQLALAAGHEEAGSMALFGLGKTYGTLAQQQSPQVVAPESKAMVFHQSAVTAAPGNFLAANELAVLAARYGRYETARTLLQHSAALAPQADIWRNLAVVHRRLGETNLAELAEKEAAAAAERAASGKLPPGVAPPADVQWVDAKTFAATAKPTTDLQKPSAAAENPQLAAPAEASRFAPWSRQSSQPVAPSAARR